MTETEIKRIQPGTSVTVDGKFGGTIYRRTPDERNALLRRRRAREYVVTCPRHLNERVRVQRTLKLAVSMAGDNSLWCAGCCDQRIKGGK